MGRVGVAEDVKRSRTVFVGHLLSWGMQDRGSSDADGLVFTFRVEEGRLSVVCKWGGRLNEETRTTILKLKALLLRASSLSRFLTRFPASPGSRWSVR
jgi:hypothetical protein